LSESLQRLDQIAKPDSFDDQLTAAQIAAIETAAVDLGEFWEGVLSQLKRIIHGNATGNWYDDPSALHNGIRDFIPAGEDVLVSENHQYIVHDNIVIDGSMTLDGKLVVL
jgi:hypothetical protein